MAHSLYFRLDPKVLMLTNGKKKLLHYNEIALYLSASAEINSHETNVDWARLYQNIQVKLGFQSLLTNAKQSDGKTLPCTRKRISSTAFSNTAAMFLMCVFVLSGYEIYQNHNKDIAMGKLMKCVDDDTLIFNNHIVNLTGLSFQETAALKADHCDNEEYFNMPTTALLIIISSAIYSFLSHFESPSQKEATTETEDQTVSLFAQNNKNTQVNSTELDIENLAAHQVAPNTTSTQPSA